MVQRHAQVNPSFSESARFDADLLLRPPAWFRRAACADAPASFDFFAELGDGDNHARRAKSVCASCVVVAECLNAAVTRRPREEFGIWGGTGEMERRVFEMVLPQRRHAEPGPVGGCGCAWCVALRSHLERLRFDARLPTSPKRRPAPSRKFGANSTHGQRATYTKGCRCRPCRYSASRWGQAVARLGVSTSALWTERAGEGSYDEQRRAVDVVARCLVEVTVGNLLGLLHPGRAQTGPDTGGVHASPVPRFLTEQQLAARWLTTDRSVRRMVAAGQLLPVRLGPKGGIVRFDLEDIERLEQQRKAVA